MKAKKKFPDLNKDGKVTKADILKGRGVFKKGGKIKAKSSSSNSSYAASKSRQAAEKMLDEKLRSEGYTHGRSDARAPKFKLTQDTKSGEYRYRKYSKGGKVRPLPIVGGHQFLFAYHLYIYYLHYMI